MLTLTQSDTTPFSEAKFMVSDLFKPCDSNLLPYGRVYFEFLDTIKNGGLGHRFVFYKKAIITLCVF